MLDYERQSFLGGGAQKILTKTRIGIIGYSGGGSHFGQQFGHIGVGRFVVVDPKRIKATHRPRFVGSMPFDVPKGENKEGKLKVDIAERQIKFGNPEAHVEKLATNWQEATDALLKCDIIFGAVDSYKERDELERFCRRNMIPLIDIGMDVELLEDGEYLISGQVIQSLSGGACMRCCNFIDDDKLTREAEKYGDAGSAPQVVWANGVLASTAVGWGVSLLCPWQNNSSLFRWVSYDGNSGELTIPPVVEGHLNQVQCPHHPVTEVGDPLCDIRSYNPNDNSVGTDSVDTIFSLLWKRLVRKLLQRCCSLCH
jgi:hypothetical protein